MISLTQIELREKFQMLTLLYLRLHGTLIAGSVCINEHHYSVQLPHGGLQQSGVGKDCSQYSLEEYLTFKGVSILIDK